jgi:hypothetical protein
MVIKKLLAISSAIAAVLLLISPPPAEASPSYLSDCGKYPVKETYAVDSAGNRTFAATAGTGTVRVFGRGDKTMSVTVPPADFDPHAATDAQLRRYGFPARPKSGPGRARWEAFYPRHKIDYVVPEMCGNPNVTHRPRLRTMPHSQAGPAAAPTPAYSPNWSGGMALAVPGDVEFTAAFIQWNEPTFNATCPSTSGYTIWSGLGGWGADVRPVWGLLQAGVDNVGGSGPNTDYAWWEALNQNDDQTLPEQVITNMKVSAGNQVQAATYYNPTDKTVSFQIYNITTNKLVTLGPWTTIIDNTQHVKGLASDFYDGSSGDIIAERPSVNDEYVDLRRPTAGYSQFLDAELGYDSDGDPYPGYQYANWQPIVMRSDAGTDLSVPAGFPTKGTPAWKNTWKACS